MLDVGCWMLDVRRGILDKRVTKVLSLCYSYHYGYGRERADSCRHWRFEGGHTRVICVVMGSVTSVSEQFYKSA
jgi:hypothetical protein